MVDAGEAEELLVNRAIVVEVAGLSRRDGAGLVDQARQVGEAAELRARAAGRVTGEVWGAQVDGAGGGGGRIGVIVF